MENAITKLITQDGGKVISVNQFDSVLIIKTDRDSKTQLERFKRTGLDLNMFKRAKIEINEDVAILSAVIKKSK